MSAPVFILGGFQTDFARHWSREGHALPDLVTETVQGALDATGIEAAAVEVGHVGNFIAELTTGQGHLGGLFVEADPAFSGLPTSRHEAACASGSVAALAAMADIESGRYGLACVLGVEWMRNLPSFDAQRALGAAAWVPRETEGVDYPWPKLFSDLGDEYERRFGLKTAHLAAIAEQNFANAKRNPNAQTREWTFAEDAFDAGSESNPVVCGRISRQDCSQVTDGGAAVLLASEEVARAHAKRRGISLASLPRIAGWGHRTARMALEDKFAESKESDFVFPHVRGAITDAFARAGVPDAASLDAIECHDCFTTTQYMAIDHFGLTAPGESWRAIEDGTTAFDGSTPVNPSGGLIGAGHPVGATGVRMLLDASKQVTGAAGNYQVAGARTVATLNIGGSATTTVSFVVTAGE